MARRGPRLASPAPALITCLVPKNKKKGLTVDEALNSMHASLRERILTQADPIGFLTKVVKGEPVEHVNAETGEVVKEYASLSMRADIALKLTGKILPDMKALELSGPEGGKIDVGDTDAFERIAVKLGRGAPARPTEATTH